MKAKLASTEARTREDLASVAAVRERFLDDQTTDLSLVRPVIARSWRRSAAAHVDPGSTTEVIEEPNIDAQTLATAAPFVRELERVARDAGGYATIVAPNGAVVATATASPNEQFPHGYLLLEDICGTNSDGAALEEGRSVWVYSREHYRESFQDTCCFSVLVRDPFRQNVRASLGLTLPESVALAPDPRATLLIVEGVAARITHELAARSAVREKQLFSEYLKTVRRYRNAAVLAMDGKHTMASNGALEFMVDEDYAVIWSCAQDALQTRRPTRHDLTLGGDRLVQVEISPAGDPADSVGAIVLLKQAAPRNRVVGGGGTALGSLTTATEHIAPVLRDLVGDSIGFRQALRLANAAVRAPGPVHIIGESGVGKATLALRIAQGWGAEPAVVDATHFHENGAAALERLKKHLGSQRPLVLRAGEILSSEHGAALTELFERYAEPRIILTFAHATSVAAQLTSALGSAEIAIPPLRTRRDDIPGFVAHFTAECTDKRPSARLLATLTQADWPGNLSQLRSVVHQAAMVARDTEVGVDDLPQSFRRGMVEGRLSRLEEAEVHELRNALCEAKGNRTLAAEILQIGRSTLYRRLNSYRHRGIVI